MIRKARKVWIGFSKFKLWAGHFTAAARLWYASPGGIKRSHNRTVVASDRDGTKGGGRFQRIKCQSGCKALGAF